MYRILAIATLLVAGCAQFPSNTAALKSRSGAEDDAVLTLVLAHFVAQEHVSTENKSSEDAVVVVDWQTAGPSFYLSDDQISSEFRDEDWSIPSDLIKDLGSRNSQVASLQEKQLGERVCFDDLSKLNNLGLGHGALRAKHPKAKGYVHFWLPGYNRNHSQAVVRFSFGPKPHGATATYLLAKEGAKWKIQNHTGSSYW